ncbi:MAG: thioredoxin family protein [Gaiella sp.]
MRSLVAWVEVTRRARLRVVVVDMDDHRSLARRLGITVAPTLLLLVAGAPAARLDGKASGKEIDEMLEPFVPARVTGTSSDAA